jgi:hypothetical protein
MEATGNGAMGNRTAAAERTENFSGQATMEKWMLVFAYLWELPQNLLGLAVWLLVRKAVHSSETDHGRRFHRVERFGISLGRNIFWYESGDSKEIKKHEYGHSIQSRRLGPLYLMLVGIPSALRALYHWLYPKLTGKPWNNYFLGYPEKWADTLGKKYY